MYAPPPQIQEQSKNKDVNMPIHRRIIVPYDGSENSFRAFMVALSLSKLHESTVMIVHACREEECTPGIFDSIRMYVEENAPELTHRIDYKILTFNPKESSASSELVREIVLGGYDLVVMSARGSSLNDELYIGSVAASIIMNTSISIYIVR